MFSNILFISQIKDFKPQTQILSDFLLILIFDCQLKIIKIGYVSYNDFFFYEKIYSGYESL